MTFGLFSEAEGFEFLRTRTPERFGFSLPFVGLLGRGKRCAERNDADEDLLPVDFGEKREGSLMRILRGRTQLSGGWAKMRFKEKIS